MDSVRRPGGFAREARDECLERAAVDEAARLREAQRPVGAAMGASGDLVPPERVQRMKEGARMVAAKIMDTQAMRGYIRTHSREHRGYWKRNAIAVLADAILFGKTRANWRTAQDVPGSWVRDRAPRMAAAQADQFRLSHADLEQLGRSRPGAEREASVRGMIQQLDSQNAVTRVGRELLIEDLLEAAHGAKERALLAGVRPSVAAIGWPGDMPSPTVAEIVAANDGRFPAPAPSAAHASGRVPLAAEVEEVPVALPVETAEPGPEEGALGSGLGGGARRRRRQSYKRRGRSGKKRAVAKSKRAVAKSKQAVAKSKRVRRRRRRTARRSR